MKIDNNLKGSLGKHEKKAFSKFITEQNKHLCAPEAIDFLEQCLIYDHVFFLFRLKG